MLSFGKPSTHLNKSIKKISISLASPDSILAKSYGEVLKPETINYRSFKPEKDGLFCEKIFGPVKDWECHCGKYKRIRYKGIICDRCGVEVTLKAVRRERMGHITLATPVVHIWYFRSLPSKLSYILGIPAKQLEKVIYYESYVVLNPGNTGLKVNELIPEEEYFRIISEFPEEKGLSDDDEGKFVARIGGEAVKEILKNINLKELSITLRSSLKTETSAQRRLDALKRLKVIEAFRSKDSEVLNRPEWMVLDVIPVIPPELRPLVPLEGGRFATSDINDLYRRVIIRNNRLKKLIEIKAPEVILRNEKRMLQEAIDSLFDNGKKSTAVRSDGNRPLKSLSDMLKGKQGRFRQNLLGKRVDYSGRSVIVVGPELKLHECGLPKDMAVELFKPFIIRKLVERGLVKTVKSAKKLVDKKGKEIWDILETIIDDHPIMLNRAPTLHRLGIQAFQPILVEGKALRIHPLVCAAFNADFDGDQMAVHIPLSYEAISETKMLMLSSHNVLSPSNGKPIAIPSQDIVLGLYYLTKIGKGYLGEGKKFSNIDEAIIAYNNKKIDLHAEIIVRHNGEKINTSAGRILFNKTLPEGIEFINEELQKRRIEQIVASIYRQIGNLMTVEFLDKLKNLGFTYATSGGLSVGLSDVITPDDKEDIVDAAMKVTEEKRRLYSEAKITDGERYNQIIDIWTNTTSLVTKKMFENLSVNQNGFNPVFMMADSGARGSKDQIRQLAGMRGLMAKPQKSMTGQIGEIIENPITSNFKEGLSVLEYFISTHGARKGLADTALKTADAGYLTRRLVDVAQDIIISEDDCGTILGIEVSIIKELRELREGENIVEKLADRILGRVAAEDIIDHITEDIIIEAGAEITEDGAQLISESNVETIKIRSVLTCETKHGACSKCYGRNLATGIMVKLGEAVGVIAAQSIGEPGTQLTLRTFHIGGIASRIAAQSEVTAKMEGLIKFDGLKIVSSNTGEVMVLNRNGRLLITDEDERVLGKYNVPYGATMLVREGEQVKKRECMFKWEPYSSVIITEKDGLVEYSDLKEDLTYREELDDQGHRQRVVTETRSRSLNPRIFVTDEEGNKLVEYIIPTRSRLLIKDGEKVSAGDVLVKIPRESSKTRDITGGLPRVAELFEARRPKEPAVVSEIDGVVEFGQIKRGVREILVTGRAGNAKTYMIPYGKHVIVHNGDTVKAGDRLSEGSVVPHDILRILGASQVQEYLVNEIQEVYRLQGVRLNDKHIEIIVRQMLQKVKIEDPGDTEYLEGDQVDKLRFVEENEELVNKVVITNPGDSRYVEGELVNRIVIERTNDKLKRQEKAPADHKQADPATFQPLLLGITQASLSTESFISAASFQETTKVLTDAAVEGKVDVLIGLKENVIMGHLIPAGTGMKRLKGMELIVPKDEAESFDENEQQQDELETADTEEIVESEK